MRIKRYLTIILLCFSSDALLAQHVPAYGGGADLHDLSFGFSFTYLTNYFKIDKNPNWQQPFFDTGTNQFITDQLTSISSKNSQGFAVGFLTRYTLEEHVEVRTTPSLIFADRSLSYTYADPTENVTKQIQTTTVDFPIELKLKTDRIGDFRGYI